VRSHFTAEQVAEAYKSTGSVWKAGKQLGLAGQTVHERLVAIGHRLSNKRWEPDEDAELAELAKTCSIAEIASRLGRTYASVACRLSENGIGTGRQFRGPRKLPRGAGFDKASIAKHLKAIDAYTGPMKRYAVANSVTLDGLIGAIQRHFPGWWTTYSRTHAAISSRSCEYCETTFYPMSGKQKTYSRKCQGSARVDKTYFGGNRRNTIGLLEGVCQLCFRTDATGLSSHHMFGKKADAENRYLIALCPGCHQMVGILAGRAFLDERGWANLIGLVKLRRDEGSSRSVFINVDIDPAYVDDDDDE